MGSTDVTRRRATETKGDRRQRAILDACESLLASKGYEVMTVGDIAQDAGITRAGLYFYYGSKDDVVTALVERTVEHLWERSRVTAVHDEPREAISLAMRRTVELWGEHGVTMRTPSTSLRASPRSVASGRRPPTSSSVPSLRCWSVPGSSRGTHPRKRRR